MKDATLCYVIQNGKVLLQKKAPGRFGGGKWNAPGGKIKMFETPEKAAVREMQEETGLAVKNPQNLGMLTFIEEKGKVFSVYVFRSNEFTGTVSANEEGNLQWFPLERIPYDEMWEDDRIWLPRLLKGKPFRGTFLFSKGFKKMIKHEIEDLKELAV